VRRFAGPLVLLGLLGLVATAILWWLPAGDFILAPDRAKPLAGRVVVQDGRPEGKGDVYYVDVLVRRLRLLEKYLPFTRPDGSTTVYFAPKQPAGVPRGNWIQTMPGKGWFIILRLYSPLEPFFDKSWRPSEIEPVR